MSDLNDLNQLKKLESEGRKRLENSPLRSFFLNPAPVAITLNFEDASKFENENYGTIQSCLTVTNISDGVVFDFTQGSITNIL